SWGPARLAARRPRRLPSRHPARAPGLAGGSSLTTAERAPGLEHDPRISVPTKGRKRRVRRELPIRLRACRRSTTADPQTSWPHGPPIWHPDCIPAPPQPFPHYFRVPYFNLDSQSEVSMRSLIPMKRTGRAIVIAVLAANVVACGSWSRTQRGAAIGGAGGAAIGAAIGKKHGSTALG